MDVHYFTDPVIHNNTTYFLILYLISEIPPVLKAACYHVSQLGRELEAHVRAQHIIIIYFSDFSEEAQNAKRAQKRPPGIRRLAGTAARLPCVPCLVHDWRPHGLLRNGLPWAVLGQARLVSYRARWSAIR
jgi:hypothetical protein